ncbi:MAG: CotH kinase family protein, partial [Oscillospiraceae bacterium]|nr:CotH kinase family protein [Oscillospiraceae bacterium]
MKRKLLAVVTLLAMMLSMFSVNVFADQLPDDEDEEEGRLDLRLRCIGGTCGSGNGSVVDRDFKAYDHGGHTIMIDAGIRKDGDFIPLGDSSLPGSNQNEVEIYWTASDTTTGGGGFTVSANRGGATKGPANVLTTGRGAGFDGVPLGTHPHIEEDLFKRHYGGLSPSRSAPGTASPGVAKYNNTAISIPTYLEGDRETFTLSFVAYSNGPTARKDDVARLTRTFLLQLTTGNPTVGNTVTSYGGTIGNRRTDWAKPSGEFLIANLYIDSHDLFDHEDGIFIPGKDREEWIDLYQQMNAGKPLKGRRMYNDGARTRPDFIDPGIMQIYPVTLPGNFNRRGRGLSGDGDDEARDGAAGGGEVAAFVEVFDHEGYRHVAQGAGARVKGGWSRGTLIYDQKTFELYARNGYNDYYGGGRLNSFYFPFFGQQNVFDNQETTNGNMVHRYRRFRLRNAGNTRDRSYLNDELGQHLAEQTGMPGGVQQDQMCVIYLNGAYYGMSFFKSPRTENHYDRIYGGRESAFHTLGTTDAASTGCQSGNRSCGRVIPSADGREISFHGGVTVQNFHWPDGASAPQTQNNDKELIAGLGADRYVGIQPVVCTGGSNSCANAGNALRAEECKQYWSSGEDMCDGVPNKAPLTGWKKTPHKNDCEITKLRAQVGDSSVSSCSDCAAVCDWLMCINIATGGPYLKKSDGSYVAAMTAPQNQTGKNKNALLLDPIGLTDQSRWDEFNERVDVEAWLHYYAVQLYWGNCDWPGNNLELWRYWPDAEEIEKINNGLMHPYLDGRWRPITFDMDFGAGFLGDSKNSIYIGSSAGYNSIQAVIDRNGPDYNPGGHFNAGVVNTFLLRAMLGGDPVPAVMDGATVVRPAQQAVNKANAIQAANRLRLANICSDLIEGAFRPSNAQTMFDKMAWVMENEHKTMLGANYVGDGHWAIVGTKLRRIAEIARPMMQFGRVMNDDAVDPSNFNNPAKNKPWGIWPRWGISTDADDNNREEDTVGASDTANGVNNSKSVLRNFLGAGAITTYTTNEGAAQRRGGRANETAGFPSFVGTTLGHSWGGRTMNVSVTVPNGANGNAKLNSRPIAIEALPWTGMDGSTPIYDPRSEGRGTAVTGKYWPGSPIPVTANPYPGYRAVWTGATPGTTPCHLNTPEKNTCIVNSAANITLNFELCPKFLEEAQLSIDGIKSSAWAKGGTNQNGWIEITNRNATKSYSTRGYYLADGGNSFKFQMPSLIIRNQQRAYIPTGGNTEKGALKANVFPHINEADMLPFLKRTKTGFNVSATERVRLSDAKENELSRVETSFMNATQSQLRGADGKFRIRNSGSGGINYDAPIERPGIGMGFGAAEARARRV